jgi:hypothetical protein
MKQKGADCKGTSDFIVMLNFRKVRNKKTDLVTDNGIRKMGWQCSSGKREG